MCFFVGLYICYLFQQTHQKNQVKDTIEVEEPEDAGEPLTAVEQEEKERLLEEVSVSTNSSWDYNYLYCCRRLTSVISRDFQHGVEETSIPLSGLVRSMVVMT